MMKLQPSETVVTGNWLIRNGRVYPDAAEERIEWLIANCLQKVKDSPNWGAWETLYKDPDDGRYWERTYPQSEMQGGGPRQLRLLSAEQVTQKYTIPQVQI